jgi:hypothetical protein
MVFVGQTCPWYITYSVPGYLDTLDLDDNENVFLEGGERARGGRTWDWGEQRPEGKRRRCISPGGAARKRCSVGLDWTQDRPQTLEFHACRKVARWTLGRWL